MAQDFSADADNSRLKYLIRRVAVGFVPTVLIRRLEHLQLGFFDQVFDPGSIFLHVSGR